MCLWKQFSNLLRVILDCSESVASIYEIIEKLSLAYSQTLVII